MMVASVVQSDNSSRVGGMRKRIERRSRKESEGVVKQLHTRIQAYHVRRWSRSAPATRAAAVVRGSNVPRFHCPVTGKLLKTSFGDQCYKQGETDRPTVPPSLLCSTKGARGLYILRVVPGGELDERKDEEVLVECFHSPCPFSVKKENEKKHENINTNLNFKRK